MNKDKRAERRRKERLLKKKLEKRFLSQKRSLNDVQSPDPVSKKAVGKAAAVHDAACSCSMCGNPRRKLFGKARKTIQELIQDINFTERDDVDM